MCASQQPPSSSLHGRARQGSSIKVKTAVPRQLAFLVNVLALGDDEIHVGMHIKAYHLLIKGLGETAGLQIEAKQSLANTSAGSTAHT
jgi:hypothetical protein